jgi:hypothetical protein
MDKEEKLFREITGVLAGSEADVEEGRMMSSPGIKYRNKVFAFYHNREMIFKLGRDFDPGADGIKNFNILSPFKNKAPLYDWFHIPYTESHKWHDLARVALERMKGQK